MKKLYILLSLTGVFGSSTIGCSFFGGGPSSGPGIEAAFPEEGQAGTAVVLDLENFNVKRDIVLFGGVPVKTMDPVDDSAGEAKASVIDERSEKLSTRETPALEEWIAVEKKVSRMVTIPNLAAGVVEITIRRGDYESPAVPFTIVTPPAPSSSASDENESGDGDSITPKDDTVAGNATGEGEGDAADDTVGPDDPVVPAPLPALPAATADIYEGVYHLGLNYVKIHWSVSYASAAFIRVPVNEWYADVLSFGQYRGQAAGPFPFGKSLDETGLLQKLASSLLDDDFGSMPFNYCVVPGQGRTILSHLHCYDVNPNRTAYNYVDVMIPLTQGQNAKSGVWKFRVPKTFNVFSIYYRDWSNNVQKKDIKVANQNIIGC
jgi:hypothetical protein